MPVVEKNSKSVPLIGLFRQLEEDGDEMIATDLPMALATFGALLPIFVQWSRADLRNAKRVDARIDAGHGMAAPVFEGHGMAATFKALRRG